MLYKATETGDFGFTITTTFDSFYFLLLYFYLWMNSRYQFFSAYLLIIGVKAIYLQKLQCVQIIIHTR